MTNSKNSWKPEFKYESVTGQFEDYRGNKRDFTMVAVSVPMDDNSAEVVMPVDVIREYTVKERQVLDDETGNLITEPEHTERYVDEDIVSVANVSKMLSVGVAVRSMRDTDNGMGVRIAYGKALKYRDHRLYVTHPGMINTKMVQALIEQEAEHFRKDPGSYLVGYNADKARYQKTGKVASAELTTDDITKEKLQINLKENTYDHRKA